MISVVQESSAKPIFTTSMGSLYWGKCEELLRSPALKHIHGQVQLLFTSPPFPLNAKKRYGNLQGEAYLAWLSGFAPLFAELLTPTGSLVMEIGNSWESGKPVQSLLPYRSLLAFIDAGGLNLCQEITYYNPARLPTPAQWVTIERIRLKDATTKIWWMAKCDKPKADNRRVLRPYGKDMRRLLTRGTYNSGRRPSEHNISETGFLKDNGGAIAPNLLEIANTSSSIGYQKFCKEHHLRPHPARMPDGIPEFFINFLTDPNDLVLDPFAGSNTTGAVAERLGRRWLAIECEHNYAISSISRFDKILAAKLLQEPS